MKTCVERNMPSPPALQWLAGSGAIVLAPMAGFTDAPLRRLCHRQGCALSFTEMTDAAGIVRDTPRTLQQLVTFPDEGPVVAHLYGPDPVTLGEAAARIEPLDRFVGIDLNAGCPVRKIRAKGAGAALMRDPDRLYAILAAMRRATRLPLMLKTRIGLDDAPTDAGRFQAILDAAVTAGVGVLTLHARTVARMHAGAPDLDRLAEARVRWPRILIGNGGIRCGADARRMFAETGVDAVMVGREARGNPWVFSELAATLAGQPWTPPDPAQRLAMLEQHLADQVDYSRRQLACHPPRGMPLDVETLAVMRFRAHLFRHLRGMPGAPRLRARLNDLFTLTDVRAAVEALASDNSNSDSVPDPNHPPANA